MVKKAKYTLSLDTSFDFELIGISCHQTDYRVCWAINLNLGLQLKKSEEPFMVSGKKGGVNSSHSFYEWEDEDNFAAFYLIKNRDNQKNLIPEHAQLDYFLVIKGGDREIDDLVTQLKEIKGILTAVKINPTDLKSSEYLIF
jgi:hypothetical protein